MENLERTIEPRKIGFWRKVIIGGSIITMLGCDGPDAAIDHAWDYWIEGKDTNAPKDYYSRLRQTWNHSPGIDFQCRGCGPNLDDFDNYLGVGRTFNKNDDIVFAGHVILYIAKDEDSAAVVVFDNNKNSIASKTWDKIGRQRDGVYLTYEMKINQAGIYYVQWKAYQKGRPGVRVSSTSIFEVKDNQDYSQRQNITPDENLDQSSFDDLK